MKESNMAIIDPALPSEVEAFSSDRADRADRPPLPAVPDEALIGKRFFYVDDGGCNWWFVARDADHVREIMRKHGVELCDDSGYSFPIDNPNVAHIEIEEKDADYARRIRCHTDDDGRGRGVIALAACDLGEWFCSEW